MSSSCAALTDSGAPGPNDPEILYSTDLLESGAVGLRIDRSEQLFRDSDVDPEVPGDGTAIAVDTLLFATQPASD